MSFLPIENTEVYTKSREVADCVYLLVTQWPPLARNTVGKQLVRAVDSIGANRVEGDSRRSDADSSRFFRYARSSAREAAHFVRRAAARHLVDQPCASQLEAELISCAKMISGLLKHRKEASTVVRESRIAYELGEPIQDGVGW